MGKLVSLETLDGVAQRLMDKAVELGADQLIVAFRNSDTRQHVILHEGDPLTLLGFLTLIEGAIIAVAMEGDEV